MSNRGIPDNGMIGLIRTPLTDAAMERLRDGLLREAREAGLKRKRELLRHPEEVARLLERANRMMNTEAIRSL